MIPAAVLVLASASAAVGYYYWSAERMERQQQEIAALSAAVGGWGDAHRAVQSELVRTVRALSERDNAMRAIRDDSAAAIRAVVAASDGCGDSRVGDSIASVLRQPATTNAASAAVQQPTRPPAGAD